MSDTTGGMKLWHPWRHARDHYPGIVIDTRCRLADGQMGELDGDTIRLCRTLTQAERRCTLAHELVHIERRGHEHADPATEERLVEAESARRLITVEQLVDAFRWHRHPTLTDLADELWVDTPTALARMENLDPIEVAQIERATDGDWSFQWTGEVA